MAIDEGLAQRIAKQRLMVRVGPVAYADALLKPHVREMDFTGRPMRGYVYVDAPGIERDEDLAYWVEAGLDFIGTLPAK